MFSHFELACKRAREEIKVPQLPMIQIREAVAQKKPAVRARRGGAVGLTSIGLAMVAMAAAAELWNGAHVVILPRGVFLSADSGFVVQSNPTGRDVATTARAMRFPVTLPGGLPYGTKLKALMRFGSGAMMMQYDLPGAWRSSDHLFVVVLAAPKSVGRADSHRYKMNLQFGRPGTLQWRIGGEDVIIPHSTITPQELTTMKKTMLKDAR